MTQQHGTSTPAPAPEAAPSTCAQDSAAAAKLKQLQNRANVGDAARSAHELARAASTCAQAEKPTEPASVPKHLTPLQQFRREKIAAGNGTIQDGISNSPNPVVFEEACARSEPEGLAPWPIRHGCTYLMNRGYDQEGLFRKPGSTRSVKSWIEQMNTDPEFELKELPTDTAAADYKKIRAEFKPDTVASFIVKFLMGTNDDNNPALKNDDNRVDGIWGFDFDKKWHGAQRQSDERLQLEAAKAIYDGLSKASQESLKLLAMLCCKIVVHTETTKMTAGKLAMCVFPAYQRPFELMILHPDAFFGTGGQL